MRKIILLDNGSLQASATLTLRSLAKNLENAIQRPVDAVSLQHANKILPDALNGTRATILSEYLAEQLGNGQRQFVLLPLFFGLNRALTTKVPELIKDLTATHADFELCIADVLYPLPAGDAQLEQVLKQNIQVTPRNGAEMSRHVVLVDHGSPSIRVNEVRQRLARSLQRSLQDGCTVSQAAMERRPGKQYDFNRPLLEDWLLTQPGKGIDSVLLCLLFLLPGRHAGPGGDIESICQRVNRQYPNFDIQVSPLVSDNPGLIKILKARAQSCLDQGEKKC